MFATNDDNEDCLKCLDLIRSRGVLDGYRLECRHCHHGIIISYGKRVYNERTILAKSNNMDNKNLVNKDTKNNN